MTSTTETRTEAWERRTTLRGDVDFTMMYVAHDAFCRDLDRLLAAAAADRVLTPPARATWTQFADMLHAHHTAEDIALWPPLSARVSEASDLATLTAMEAEHAELDPLVEQITAALADGRADDIERTLPLLDACLRAHMRHEEDAALPLLERTLGQPGWDAFGQQMRSQIGLNELPTMLPWLLESADPAAAQRVLATMPAPVRLLYRARWSARFRRTERLR